MQISSVTFLPEQFIKAIGATLLHSIWQGVVLAAITGLIMVSTRNSKSNTRYNLLVSALILFFASAVVTLAIEINSFNTISFEIIDMKTVVKKIDPVQIGQFSQELTVFNELKNYLAQHSNLFVLSWFLLVLARSFQLLVGLNGLHHLRKTSVFPTDGKWQKMVDRLASQLQINQMVLIAESTFTKVPLVIGHLKPLVLIPVGLLTALPPAEIEAILIHELAHIYRRDYLINILQSLVEILFFFNPAVLWLSSLIKAEREHCCDDIAVEQTSSKINYIRALVSCQEYQLSAPAYAMALGKKGTLKSRVSRLVYNNNKTLNRTEKSMLAICIVAVCIGIFAFSSVRKIDRLLGNTSKVVKDLTVDVKNNLKDPKLPVVKLMPFEQKTPPICKVAVDTPKLIRLKKLDGNLVPVTFARLDSIKQRLSSLIDTTQREDGEQRLPVISAMKPVAPISMINEKTEPAAPVKRASIGELVKEDLMKDGLINRVDNSLSFMLNEKELIVNGKKIRDELYKKYKSKYVPVVGKNSWTLYHNYDTSTTVSTKITVS